MKIYTINIGGQVVYVGQSKNLKQRYRQHKYLLTNNKHQNAYLQAMYNKHGSFELMEILDNATGRDEQLEINKHNTKQRMNRTEPGIKELRTLHRNIYK